MNPPSRIDRRHFLKFGTLDPRLLWLSVLSNVIWMLLAATIYLAVLRHGRENGTLTRVTSH